MQKDIEIVRRPVSWKVRFRRMRLEEQAAPRVCRVARARHEASTKLRASACSWREYTQIDWPMPNGDALEMDYRDICSPDILGHQIAALRSNTPGCDGITRRQLAREAETRLPILANELEREIYQPSPGLCVDHPEGKQAFPVCVPSAEDRTVERALLKTVLEPGLEYLLAENQHAYRPRRSYQFVHHAVDQRVQTYNYVLQADVAACFESVWVDLLLHNLNPLLPAPVYKLLRRFLRSGVTDGERTIPFGGVGLQRGRPLSGWAWNIYCAPFAHEMLRCTPASEIYCDDFVVFAQSRKRLNKIREYMLRGLPPGVRLKKNKTKIVALVDGERFNFLGYSFGKDGAYPLFSPKQAAADIVCAPVGHRGDVVRKYINQVHLGDVDGFWERVQRRLGRKDQLSVAGHLQHRRVRRESRRNDLMRRARYYVQTGKYI